MSDTTIVQFRLPDLGEGVVETEIIRWLVGEGDVIGEDQPMVEVMTDKATVEIPSPAAGTVRALCAPAGTTVAVGSVIVEIEGDASSAATSNTPVNAPSRPTTSTPAAPRSATPTSGRAARVQATPLVRKLAASLGVDLSTVTASAPNGRISEDDVRAAAAAAAGTTSPAPASGALSAAPVPVPVRDGVRHVVPLQGMRKQIADHLTKAQQVPVVTVVEECELTEVEAARREAGVGFLPYLIRAVIAGFAAVPELNAWLDADHREVVQFERVDMGIAVQTDAGLVVPVVRDATSGTLAELEARIADLADRAKSGTLAPAELRGGTFTITSAGKLGGLFTTPLLNVPEVGILGLHRAEDRAVVRDGEIVIRRMANLSVTFDHRALDGLAASRFLLTVIEALQQPASLT